MKYFIPTRLNKAPMGTIWEQYADEDSQAKVYVQINEDENYPEWISIGQFISVAMQDQIKKPDFIQDCLTLYKAHTKK